MSTLQDSRDKIFSFVHAHMGRKRAEHNVNFDSVESIALWE